MKNLTKKEIDHLEWMYHRMISVHKENKNYDYMKKFIEIIEKLKNDGKDEN
jgi:hypothetical protein